jgi:hypothetical protein
VGAKTWTKRAREDLKTASRDEVIHSGAVDQLGENPNSVAVVANRGQGWMLWLGDNLAKQTVPSIYKGTKRWPVNLVLHGGGQRKRSLVQAIGGSYRGGSPAITGYR